MATFTLEREPHLANTNRHPGYGTIIWLRTA
jgi:hypothetical protein